MYDGKQKPLGIIYLMRKKIYFGFRAMYSTGLLFVWQPDAKMPLHCVKQIIYKNRAMKKKK